MSPHVKRPAPSIFGLSLSLVGFRVILLPIVLLAYGTVIISAQESLLSTEENYYEFLALNGSLERPYLNYRTLSDSVWDTSDLGDHPWAGNNLGSMRRVSDRFAFRVYGPELFSSYNSAAPYGQNDGALWQGKGFNASLSAGARGEFTFGDAKVELTLKPTVYGSQNLPYDFVAPAYSETESDGIYAGKASEYGYYGIKYIDAPQRFGDDAFGGFSWGDSEIRLSWKTLTAGFGTQAIWLGPAKINPILMSNNAPPFPKADIGLRKTEVIMPWLGWDLGAVEGRLVAGYLSESDWFDNDSGNDHHLLSLLNVSYSPSILPELTLFANRVYLSKFDETGFPSLGSLFFVNLDGGGAQDVWDQRASIGFDLLVPSGSIEVYGEAGINDYGPSLDGYIRYPFHSMVYTAGVSKGLTLPFGIPSDIIFEWSNLEMSQDFQFQWPSTFYAHHQIKTGYTNGGQWLGAGNGTGGNSQYLCINAYHHNHNIRLYMHRINPDNDFIYKNTVGTTATENTQSSPGNMKDFKSILTLGVFIESKLATWVTLQTGCEYSVFHNSVYESLSFSETEKEYQFRIIAGVQKVLP